MIIITGANGQLGTELRCLFDERGQDYLGVDVDTLDITDAAAVDAYFADIKPTVIYHCAACTAVDLAEDEGRESSYRVNVTGTENIVRAAKGVSAVLVYLSTDYVFGGDKPLNEEWQTGDPVDPQNEYGRTKALGEQAITAALTDCYIVRTSWLFGQYGHNFVFTMRKLAETHEQITVVNDQYGRPTWARSLAEFLTWLVDNQEAFGVYHFSNEGTTTWYDFAREILKDTPVEVLPISSAEYPQKAKRPANSMMDLSKAKATGFAIPTWQEALRLFDASQTDTI